MNEQEKRLTQKEKDDLVAAIIDASNRIVESLKGRKPDRIAEGQADGRRHPV